MAPRRAIAKNRQTGLVLVQLWFEHQVACLLAPTVGSPSASPPAWVSAVALRFAVLARLGTGSALELAPVGRPFASPTEWLSPVALQFVVLARLATGSALELASVWL